MKEIDEHIIKIQGKATLFASLDLSNNYKVEADGEITDITESSNQDGTVAKTYKFKPTLVRVINDNGEVTKTKDTRSRSQQLRAVLRREWQQSNEQVTDEEYYDREMLKIIAERIKQNQN